jgi:hypothetical protein
MKNENEHLKALSEIRDMMEQSTRFLSLSGLSGVFAGIFAIIGSVSAFIFLNTDAFNENYYLNAYSSRPSGLSYNLFFILDALVVLFLAITFCFVLTSRNARKKNQPLWTKSSKLLLINLFIPLIAGGLFCLILLSHKIIYLIAPSMLLFYGLALLNAGKYTLKEIRLLGITEIILGLISCIYVGYGLIFWTIGFGFLHIIYGTYMYVKYEK